DYDLQRFGATGPHLAPALRVLDACGGAIAAAGRERGADVTVVSEYGIRDVSRPVFPNRVLREHGFLAVRPGPFGEVLETFQSRAFAVADHQIAHVYVRRPEDAPEVRRVLAATPGIAEVLDENGKRAYGVDHPRSGELVALAAPDAWMDWQFYFDESAAPDYAYTIDIHRKPGYDPGEMFFNERWRAPKLHAAWRLLRKKLGFRSRFDVISHDPGRIRGSHGLPPADPMDGPIVLSTRPLPECLTMTGLGDFVLDARG
ncbi:MAG: alkaline phosphatase family protein, partial [Planctomycetes bacterium]|nr:alkaline phosphatase family protein [Planctomycetota bacterium]